MKKIKIGRFIVPIWFATILLISGICAGVLAYYLWPAVTVPFEVQEPLGILDYSPSEFSLFPGEAENLTATVQNQASMNYSAVLDFQLNDTVYQTNYVKFSDKIYTITPGQQDLFAWLIVEPDAPAINASLTISLKRIRTEPPPQADLLVEEWNSLADWNRDGILVQINPIGQLHTIRGKVWHYMNFPTQFTIELELKVDFFGEGYAGFQVYTSMATYRLDIYSDIIRMGNSLIGFEQFDESTDNEWHVWKATIDQNVGEAKVYKDDFLLTTFTRFDWRTDLTPRFVTLCSGDSTCEVHWDYHYITSGILP